MDSNAEPVYHQSCLGGNYISAARIRESQEKRISLPAAIGFAALMLLLPACSNIPASPDSLSEETQFATWDEFLTASDEAFDNQARCMTERGIEAQHHGGGAFTFGQDVIVDATFDAIDVECRELYPAYGFNSVMSEAAWTRFFTAVVEHARCREKFGIALAAQPPSIQTMVDYAVSNDAVWGPWAPDAAQWDPLLESQAIGECGAQPWVLEFVVE